MAKQTLQAGVQVSLLDRLIDLEPRVQSEPVSSRAQSLRQLKASLRRDIEWLLNARHTPVEPLPGAKELPRSVYYYGLPDLSSFALTVAEDQNRLAHLMETVISIFEPRLLAVSVTLQPTTAGARILRFRIEGLLRIEPGPERIFFDTSLELTSSQYQVEG